MQPRLQTDFSRKVQQARQAGFTDQQIQSYLALRRPQQTTQPTQQQPKSSGGFQPSALISEGGGLAGALTGGAIGSAIFPGVGTVIGAGLGGLIGGFGGSAAEQKVRDDKVDFGKATREGLIEGLTAAGPIKLARIGTAAAKGTVKGVGKKALKETLQEAATRPGLLSRTGATLQGEARGIDVGARLGGKKINQKKVDEINNFLTREVKLGGGSASKQAGKLESFVGKKNTELSNLITKSNRNLTDRERLTVVNKFDDYFTRNVISPTDRQRQILDDLKIRAGEVNDIKGLDDLRKLIDDQINFARNPASPDTASEQVYLAARRLLTDEVGDRVGGAKNLKSALSKAYDAEELILNRAAQRTGGLQPFGVPVPGRLTQSLQSAGGRALSATGQALDTRSLPAIATRSLLAQGGGVGAPQATPTDMLTDSLGEVSDMGLGATGMEQSPTQQPQSRLTQEQINQAILLDLQETGGQNVEAIQMIASMYGPQSVSGAADFESLSADQQKRVINLNNVASALDQLESDAVRSGLFREEPQIVSTLRGPVERLVGSATSPEKRAYIQQVRSRGIQVIRALGEVGNLSQTEQEAAIGNLPTVGDNAETAALKLQSLRELFDQVQQSTINPVVGAQ